MENATYCLLKLSGNKYEDHGGIVVKIHKKSLENSISYIKNEHCLDYEGYYETSWVKEIQALSMATPFDGHEGIFLNLNHSTIGKKKLSRYYADLILEKSGMNTEIFQTFDLKNT